MTTLLRKMWKNHSKHKKLCEEWALAECEGEGWWRETRDAGAAGQLDVRYAGAAPVERAASAPATAIAVRSALHSAKTLNKKLQRVNLDISAKGIIVTDADSQDNVLSVSIYNGGLFVTSPVRFLTEGQRWLNEFISGPGGGTERGLEAWPHYPGFNSRGGDPSVLGISYCSADASNARVFAVVEGRSDVSLEAHVAHVFVCSRRKHARALALSLAHAFNDAYQAWQSNQGSSFSSGGKRSAPWVRFPDESEEDEEIEDWNSPAPLVTFG